MIIKLKSFVALLSFMLVLPYLAWCCGDYRTKSPPIMNTWKGYFDPHITFYNDCGSHTVAPGSIRYLSNESGKLFGYSFFGLCSGSTAVMLDAERSNVEPQYRSRLDKKKLFLYSGKKYNDSISDSSYNQPCICVAYVTIGTYNWDHTYFGDLAGPCIILPMPPGPPPFTDVFASDVTVNIVPDSDSTVFSAKLRAVFRKNGSVYCKSSKSWVPSTEKCSDGTNGDSLISVVLDYGRWDEDKVVDVTILDVHKFRIKKGKNAICGEYYGSNDYNENNLIFEQCYENSFFKILLQKNSNHVFEISLDKFSVDLPSGFGLKHDPLVIPLNVLDNLVYSVFNNDIYIFDGALDDSYFLKKKQACLNEKFQIQEPLEDNVTSTRSCNEGYNLNEIYINDKNSNMRCIYPINQYPPQYLLLRKNSKGVNIPHHLRQTNHVFMPYSFSQNLGKYVLDSKLPVIKQNDNQDVLNTIRYLGSGMFSIKKNGVEASYKYEPEKHYSLEDNAWTDFLDRANNRIVLSKTDLENLKPLDPHLNFQCQQIEYDAKQECDLEYDEKYQSLSYDPKAFGCDAVKIQAWGAGSAAKYDSNSSYTGANGGFIEGTVYLSNPSEKKNMLKVTIGRGGRDMGEDGGDTLIQICSSVSVCDKYKYNNEEVSICDIDESTCEELITAKGGSSKPKELFINSQRIIMPRGVKGLSIMPESDGLIPNIYSSLNISNNTQYLRSSMIAIDSTVNSGRYENTAPSTGGYVNQERKIWQAGGDGIVNIKCEIWKKDGVKTLKKNPFGYSYSCYNEAQLALMKENNIPKINIP